MINFDDNFTAEHLSAVHVIDSLLCIVLRLVLNSREPERSPLTAGGYLEVDNVPELVEVVVEHLLVDAKVQVADVEACSIALRFGYLWPVVMLLRLLVVAASIVSVACHILVLRVVIVGAPVEVARCLFGWLRLLRTLYLVHFVALLPLLQLGH